MNMVKCMLSEKKIPKTFWPEAVNWTRHVLNRSPTLAVKDVTPEEAQSGCKPSIAHFRVFGCVVQVHVLDVKRTKLENKSFTYVLLGISDESKAYRLYDHVAKKIVISKDIVFEENRAWNWDKSYEEQVVDLEWGNDDDKEAASKENEEVTKENTSPISRDESMSSNSGEEWVRRTPDGWKVM